MTPEKAVAILTTLSVMYSDVMVDTTPEELQEALEYGINAIRRENWEKIDSIGASTKIQANDCMWCDDGFFTRDDERDYIERPLTEMIENQYGVKASARCYIENGNNLDVDINLDDGYSFNIKLDKPIDMRRIRLPKDLQKYVSEIFDKFSSEYSSATMYDEVEASTKIVASDDSRWDDSWRDNISEEVYDRLCTCCNSWKDIKIMGRAIKAVNPTRSAEECAERILEWVCDWNNQWQLDPTEDEYKELLAYIDR